jgi:hypothetical protein
MKASWLRFVRSSLQLRGASQWKLKVLCSSRLLQIRVLNCGFRLSLHENFVAQGGRQCRKSLHRGLLKTQHLCLLKHQSRPKGGPTLSLKAEKQGDGLFGILWLVWQKNESDDNAKDTPPGTLPPPLMSTHTHNTITQFHT